MTTTQDGAHPAVPASNKASNAREDPLNTFAEWMLTGRGSRQHADRILDRHAHELAEQQRAHLLQQGYDLDCVCGGCSACLARDYIDLIDPEAQP
ncbi:hypothetical protein GCM10014715_74820 [Streptomyces spiralis]|uniref:Uncharacterized protein n=1 Tax=Streptomyces spiralis TaxID=66376 RepID=A0A919AJC2_9ACTN|nr:hypothetical protein [Streptomyces spiralis]GHF07950.1 hypothetical protein GCM10014715_74820 [Streptomyces spiralis]